MSTVNKQKMKRIKLR